MSFKTKQYEVVEGIIPPLIADVVFDYLLLRRKVQKTLISKKIIDPTDELYGHYHDWQAPNTWCLYGDPLCEVLLHRLLSVMSQVVSKTLIPHYTYARLYKKGDVLKKHVDRTSCTISATIFLGGDEWPIFLKTDKKKPIKVELKPGDALVYKGEVFPHWRNKFTKVVCGQLFVHYGYQDDPTHLKNIFDKRDHLGLPYGQNK